VYYRLAANRLVGITEAEAVEERRVGSVPVFIGIWRNK